MRPIDADTLKAHYAWWECERTGRERKELFDEIVDQQPTIEAESAASPGDAVDAGFLADWFISSVGEEPPVWTEEHIVELLKDFYVIPKGNAAKAG